MNFAYRHPWRGNFRELNAIVTRLATLAPGGRIDLQTVNKEIDQTQPPHNECSDELLLRMLGNDYSAKFDFFELVQLKEVLKVCAECRNMSEAGRRLFAVSRLEKKSCNDSDRLARYLSHFGIHFSEIQK